MPADRAGTAIAVTSRGRGVTFMAVTPPFLRLPGDRRDGLMMARVPVARKAVP